MTTLTFRTVLDEIRETIISTLEDSYPEIHIRQVNTDLIKKTYTEQTNFEFDDNERICMTISKNNFLGENVTGIILSLKSQYGGDFDIPNLTEFYKGTDYEIVDGKLCLFDECDDTIHVVDDDKVWISI